MGSLNLPIFSVTLLTPTPKSYGVARVYSQQCGYILSDAQAAHSNMRALLEAVRTAEIDINAGKARYKKTLEYSEFRKLTHKQPRSAHPA